MEMSFWFGTSVEEFMFTGCKITTLLSFIVTCLVVMSFAFLFEVLKLKLQTLATKHQSKMKIAMHGRVCPNDCHSSGGVMNENYSRRFGPLLLQTLLYVTQYIMGSLIMLAVMTYNGYFTLSVALGGGLGYLVFGQGFMKLQLKKAALRKNCAGCTDQCGELQQSDGITTTTTSTEQTTRSNVVLGKVRAQGNDDSDRILETCEC